jgi:hypothetical protein
MEFSRKVLIAIILIMSIYIIFQLVEKRRKILTLSRSDAIDGFSMPFFSSPNLNQTPNTIINYKGEKNTALKTLCIKSSYNTAWMNNTISIDNVRYALQRGCRFIDFEIYLLQIGNQKGMYAPYVSYPTSKERLLLGDVFASIVEQAFQDSTTQNRYDPLFIQLRMSASNIQIYSLVGMAIQSNLSSYLYTQKVTGDTLMSDILGKIVIVNDKSLNFNYMDLANYVNCQIPSTVDSKPQCMDLANYVNVEIGTTSLSAVKYSLLKLMSYEPLEIDVDGITPNVKKWKIVYSESESGENPKLSHCVLKYGIQIIACGYNNVDRQLIEYEEFFNHFNSAFVTLSSAYTYLEHLPPTKSV